ncbi:MAG: hypothetical protein ACYS1A_18460, partial [Planctomycetota bacterium]
IFPDGSATEEISSVRHAPSADPYRRALAVLRFWQLRLDYAVQEFTHHKANLFNATQARFRNNQTPPDVEAIGKLLLLKEKVNVIKCKLEEVERDAADCKPDNLKRNENIMERNNIDCAGYADAIKSIEI